MTDFTLFEIGDISVIVLVVGIVEAAKKFGLKGRACQALAVTLGALLIGMSQAIQGGMVPVGILPWINIVVVGLGGGLAASGLYDVAKGKIKKPSV